MLCGLSLSNTVADMVENTSQIRFLGKRRAYTFHLADNGIFHLCQASLFDGPFTLVILPALFRYDCIRSFVKQSFATDWRSNKSPRTFDARREW
jgi:hypothetical protein